MDSPNMNQVNIGKTTNPVQEPINLADQTDSVDSETSFQAYQKHKLVGTPNRRAAASGVSAHQSENFCRFN